MLPWSAHYAQNIIDLDEDVRQQNGRVTDGFIRVNGPESEIVVFRPGDDHEHIGQLMLDDESFEIVHVGFAHAQERHRAS